MMMMSNIKRFELSASIGWVKLTCRDGEEILLYPEDALNLAAWVAENQEALVDACLRLEAEEELARHSVGAPDLPTRQEARRADPTVEFVMAPKPEQRQPEPRQPGSGYENVADARRGRRENGMPHRKATDRQLAALKSARATLAKKHTCSLEEPLLGPPLRNGPNWQASSGG